MNLKSISRVIPRFFFVCLIFLQVACASAQPGSRFSVDNKKATEQYNQAFMNLKSRNYALAQELLEKSLKKEPGFIEAWMLNSEVAQRLGDLPLAIAHMEKAISLDPNFFPNNYYVLADMYHRNGQYEKVASNLDAYDGFGLRDEYINVRAALLRQSAEYAAWAVAHPVDFDPVNLGPGINSEFEEYFPCITADNETVLFTRRVRSNEYGWQEDFFTSQKDGEGWTSADPMLRINTEGNEGAPTLSADGRILIFTACDLGNNQWLGGRNGFGSCDLFYSEKIGKAWSQPQNLGEKVNSFHWESQPSYSADGRTLYFIRGKAGARGYEGMDIYTSTKSLDGNWTTPRKMSDLINTEFNEESVLIHPDGETLYFSSNGHPGMGGLDIYMSKLGPDGKWQTPVNLGYPINTAGDENSIMVNAQGNLAFFASDREGGFGGLDLYQFELPESAKANPVTYAQGRVFDSETKAPLGAYFELIDLATGKTAVRSESDPKTGDFLVCLPANRDYALNVSKDGYLFYSDHFELDGNPSEIFTLDVPLKPFTKGQTVVLRNVFFDTDSYALKESSKVELNKLVWVLKDNPALKIEISGHTDDVGNDESNLTLSTNRAQSVVAYLIEKGIESERLMSQGYGESQPLVPNDSDANRAKNRRTEFVVR